MGDRAPFLYQPESRTSFQSSFDPRAVTRASWTAPPPRPKQEGPLITFNRHPDSWYTIYSSTYHDHMDTSIKKRITIVRIVQLVLRGLELIGAAGCLALLIMVKGMSDSTAWILRIPPGVAIIHTSYSIFHLSRRASGRTPASSASYMLFASACDVSVIPFYIFIALLSAGQYKIARNGTDQSGEWTTILSEGQDLVLPFSESLFLAGVITGGLHLISMIMGVWLAVKFYRISNLPPDANPLEDNLTSRHKKSKSSVSTVSTEMSGTEYRSGEPLEMKRRSGAPYEDLSRPPSIPFLQTRRQSTDSYSAYNPTPPPSRGQGDMPARQYQVNHNQSRVSVTELPKRASGYHMVPSKRGSYMEVATTDDAEIATSPSASKPNFKEAWFSQNSQFPTFEKDVNNTVDKRSSYHALSQQYDSTDDASHPNPLRGNPPASKTRRPKSYSALSEVSPNKQASGDDTETKSKDADAMSFKSKRYEDFVPATPPLMIGQNRQVSSGNDLSAAKIGRRDVSGKVAEEGRGGNLWGTRLRKTSGIQVQ